jgi:hypothetical protein
MRKWAVRAQDAMGQKKDVVIVEQSAMTSMQGGYR